MALLKGWFVAICIIHLKLPLTVMSVECGKLYAHPEDSVQSNILRMGHRPHTVTVLSILHELQKRGDTYFLGANDGSTIVQFGRFDNSHF